MDLIVDNEVYKIKVGAEIYSLNYPSLEQSKSIKMEAGELKTDEDAEDFIEKWLKKLGLEDKFFTLDAVKKKHFFKIWSEVNSIKK